MAIYKHAEYATRSTDGSFDIEYAPGAVTPLSGIYRCLGCGREEIAAERAPLPPEMHHLHASAEGPVRWRLAVYADHQSKG